MTQVTIDPEVTSDDQLWAALSYPIPLVPLIALFMSDKKARPFIKYHSVQGLAFNIAVWSIYLILTLVTVGLAAICVPAVWLVTFWPAGADKPKRLPLINMISPVEHMGLRVRKNAIQDSSKLVDKVSERSCF